MAKIIHLKGFFHTLLDNNTMQQVYTGHLPAEDIYINTDVIFDVLKTKGYKTSKSTESIDLTLIRTFSWRKLSNGLRSYNAISTDLSIDEVIKLVND
jgi:hypothetical protein